MARQHTAIPLAPVALILTHCAAASTAAHPSAPSLSSPPPSIASSAPPASQPPFDPVRWIVEHGAADWAGDIECWHSRGPVLADCSTGPCIDCGEIGIRCCPGEISCRTDAVCADGVCTARPNPLRQIAANGPRACGCTDAFTLPGPAVDLLVCNANDTLRLYAADRGALRLALELYTAAGTSQWMGADGRDRVQIMARLALAASPDGPGRIVVREAGESRCVSHSLDRALSEGYGGLCNQLGVYEWHDGQLRPPPPLPVRLVSTGMIGTDDGSAVSRAVDAALRTMGPCLREGVAERADFVVAVDAQRAVQSVTVSQPGMQPDIAQCWADRLRAMTFDRSTGGTFTQVLVTVETLTPVQSTSAPPLPAPRTWDPVVELGAPRIEGRATPGNPDAAAIRRVVRRNLGQVRYCYERQASAGPAPEGSVVVRFVLGTEGSVLASTVDSHADGLDDASTCAAVAVRRWQFPSPAASMTVLVPFRFRHTTRRIGGGRGMR